MPGLAIKEKPRPFALRFAEPLVSQEEVDRMIGDTNTKISMSRISPTHVATGTRYDIEPDDE